MTMTTDTTTANAILVLAASVDRIADALAANTAALQAARTGRATAPPAGPPSGPPPASAAKPEKTTEQKMAGKVWGICKDNDWNQAEICGGILGFPVPDTRKLSRAQLATILNQFAEWGYTK
jgi:hypothetical protein